MNIIRWKNFYKHKKVQRVNHKIFSVNNFLYFSHHNLFVYYIFKIEEAPKKQDVPINCVIKRGSNEITEYMNETGKRNREKNYFNKSFSQSTDGTKKI